MSARILVGDCREILRTLPEKSVHCCITSPPYFGLRDYGTGEWIGGDPECQHAPTNGRQGASVARAGRTTIAAPHRQECRRCGASRVDRQIGLEATPDEFVAAMVAVFREVRRVLRDDGVLWLNLGDSYATDGRKGRAHMGKGKNSAYSTWSVRGGYGIKQKDLIGIPWRVAFALQADGWYLRQDIIWHKPNPMPESVRDRCTKAHEYLFLLSKSARYYFDAEAIKEPASDNPVSAARRNRADFCTVGTKAIQGTGFGQSGQGENAKYKGETRNRRSVWTVATRPFKGAHFATFPPDLIEPCILAGCPAGGTALDPFGGAGTTGLVAARTGRQSILIELNPEYAAMARERIDSAPVAPKRNKSAATSRKAKPAQAPVQQLDMWGAR